MFHEDISYRKLNFELHLNNFKNDFLNTQIFRRFTNMSNHNKPYINGNIRFQMMHKSQFHNIGLYEWCCAPGSHNMHISQKS